MKSARVNAEVQRELSSIIMNDVKDPRIHPMTSVTGCDVTADLKYCKVYISVLADEKSKKETMEGLKNAAPFIRHQLAVTVNLRNTPELTFIFDDSIEKGMYMSKLISEVKAKDDEIIAKREDMEKELSDEEEAEEENND